MPIITELPESTMPASRTVHVWVTRHMLSHRRWRHEAEDGMDIAVALDRPCEHGTCVHMEGDIAYVVQQQPERVLSIQLPKEPEYAARLGWFFGNHHCPADIREHVILVGWSEQMEATLARSGIPFTHSVEVFSPPAHSAHHAH